jgi:hypothetical protein
MSDDWMYNYCPSAWSDKQCMYFYRRITKLMWNGDTYAQSIKERIDGDCSTMHIRHWLDCHDIEVRYIKRVLTEGPREERVLTPEDKAYLIKNKLNGDPSYKRGRLSWYNEDLKCMFH